MTALSLDQAAAVALGEVRRSGGAPVRRGSAEAGSFEHLFFAEPAPGECDRLLRAARAAVDAGKRGRRTARLEGRAMTAGEAVLAGVTASAVRVYEELLALARLNRGRVFPGYDRLAERTALGRATVARALNALEAAGFLQRRRRYRRVEGEGAGPRVAQASNAYRPTFPERLAALLLRRLRPAPLPPCEADRAREVADQAAAMRATLTCRELAEATLGGALGRVMARLGARIDARPTGTTRESHYGLGTSPGYISPGRGRCS
jgi:predicted transcriptional regulator